MEGEDLRQAGPSSLLQLGTCIVGKVLSWRRVSHMWFTQAWGPAAQARLGATGLLSQPGAHREVRFWFDFFF